MKFLFVATVQSHICQFHLPTIKMLKDQGHEVHIAAGNNLDVKPGLKIEYADRVFNVPFNRSPFSAKNIKAYKELKEIIKKNKYDIVHCNTPMGGVLARLAVDLKTTKIVYMAHGFHFYKGAPLINWLVYLPIEWLMAFRTDTIVCINKEDYAFAKKHLKSKKVEFVHGVGVNTEKFSHSDKTKEEKRAEIKIPKDAFVVFSVGELNKNKNHETIIKAIAQIQDEDIHYCIAGNGDLKEHLTELAQQLGIGERVHFLGYRRDINELLACSDIFAFPSYREGLPVSLVEAISSGIPVVCSKIRGNIDLVADDENGYLCMPSDANMFAEKIKLLKDNEKKRGFLAENNMKRIFMYSEKNVIAELKSIYEELLEK